MYIVKFCRQELSGKILIYCVAVCRHEGKTCWCCCWNEASSSRDWGYYKDLWRWRYFQEHSEYKVCMHIRWYSVQNMSVVKYWSNVVYSLWITFKSFQLLHYLTHRYLLIYKSIDIIPLIGFYCLWVVLQCNFFDDQLILNLEDVVKFPFYIFCVELCCAT